MEKVQVRESQLELESLEAAENELQTEYMQDPAKKSTGDQTTGAAWGYLSDCTLKGAARKAVLIAVLVVIWVLLGMPTLMFYLPQVRILICSLFYVHDLVISNNHRSKVKILRCTRHSVHSSYHQQKLVHKQVQQMR